MKYQVSIVVVTHPSSQEIVDCLRSICEQEGVSIQLIIADNASTDGVRKAIDRFFSTTDLPLPNTTLVRQAECLDEAYGLAKGKYLFLLKPEMVFEKADELARLIAYTESHPTVGSVGANRYDPLKIKHVIQQTYAEASRQCQRLRLWRFIFPSQMKKWREYTLVRDEAARYLGI